MTGAVWRVQRLKATWFPWLIPAGHSQRGGVIRGLQQQPGEASRAGLNLGTEYLAEDKQVNQHVLFAVTRH